MAASIAVVEDDSEMADYLRALLRQKGYGVSVFPTPGRFFDGLLHARPDAVLLDMQLPGMNGREVLRVLRANPETRGLIVIAVSGELNTTGDIVDGLRSGADEYFLKPVDPEMLLVRLEGLLSRSALPSKPPEEVLRLGDLSVNVDGRVCSLGGRDVGLTRLEFDLLVYFLRQGNRVLTRSILLESVWSGDPTMTTRTVDKHVENLRRKLGPFGSRIETVVRVGYILRA